MSDWLIGSGDVRVEPSGTYPLRSPSDSLSLLDAIDRAQTERRGEAVSQAVTVPLCASCRRLLDECDAQPCAPRQQQGRAVRRG